MEMPPGICAQTHETKSPGGVGELQESGGWGNVFF